VDLFNERDELTISQIGRMSGFVTEGEGKDSLWTYLCYASCKSTLVHELSHVVLHVFERCGINPCEGGGEPFCYMLSQLLIDLEIDS
jgi:hypothetical protein